MRGKQKKYLICGGVLAVALLVVILILTIINVKYSATLEVLVAPTTAKVIINGKEYKNGTYRLEPGEVTASITLDGFKSKELPVMLSAGATTKLYTYLMPENGGYEWYLAHPDEQMLLNTIGDALAAEASKNYAKANPIVEVLPLIFAEYDEKWNYTEFRVDGGDYDECSREFCLMVTDTTSGNYEKALALIREKGFDPEEYEILYRYKPVVPLN